MQRDTVRLVKLADAKIEGRIDAVENRKIYGWAWDRMRPEDQLKVEIKLGDRIVATGVADQTREDLAAGGIGNHAFVLDLIDMPEAVELAQLEALVTAPGSGHTSTLKPGVNAGVPLDHALAQPIGRIAELLEAAVAGNRQIMQGQQALARELRSLASVKAEPDETSTKAMQQIEASQKMAGAQISQLEMVTIRLDQTIAELNTKLGRFERARATELNLRRMVWVVGMLALGSLVAAAFAVATVTL